MTTCTGGVCVACLWTVVGGGCCGVYVGSSTLGCVQDGVLQGVCRVKYYSLYVGWST